MAPTPDDDDKSIKSYCFLDLETTGLPDFNFGKTKITEISLVACSKEHFLASPQLPRVLQKLTLCVYPWRRISLGAENVTKLTNEMLEKENKFDKNVGDILRNFIQHLQSPCCLIAHNGFKFDFPIIQKELKDVGVELPESVYAADSLPIFRTIDMEEEYQLAEASVRPLDQDLNEDEQKKLEKIAQEFETGDTEPKQESTISPSEEVEADQPKPDAVPDDVNSLELDCFINSELEALNKVSDTLNEEINPNPVSNGDEPVPNQDVNSLELDAFIESELTLLENQTEAPRELQTTESNDTVKPKLPEDFQKLNETTPKLNRLQAHNHAIPSTSKRPPSPGVTPVKEGSQSELQNNEAAASYKNGTKGIKRKAEARRTLFGKNFKLPTIYEHYYNEAPDQSHYAEADVITLMKCALATRDSFARLVNKTAIPFSKLSD